MLIDGIGSLDLSASDPDHAVTINPLTAERIEVLRGPSRSAVRLVGDRRRRQRHRHANSAQRPRWTRRDRRACSNYGTAANERSGNLGIDVPLGGHFVAHADGAYSKYDDLHVGGHLLSEPLRRQALASPDPDIRALADLKGKLPNTAGRTRRYRRRPRLCRWRPEHRRFVSHHDASATAFRSASRSIRTIEAEQPTIDGRQTRGDARVTSRSAAFFKIFEFRGGISKYHHDELDADGRHRLQLLHPTAARCAPTSCRTSAAVGAAPAASSISTSTSGSRGDEKYLPDSENRNSACSRCSR